jgi:hypothetical protein
VTFTDATFSSWDAYKKELEEGSLDWTPVHRSEKFWRENAVRFEENQNQPLKLLVTLIKVALSSVFLLLLLLPNQHTRAACRLGELTNPFRSQRTQRHWQWLVTISGSLSASTLAAKSTISLSLFFLNNLFSLTAFF